MDTLVLSSKPFPRPISELAKRDELIAWLTRVLFNIFIHGQSPPTPINIRLPHNLVAYFGLLMHLHQAGYPAHWLSDFLAKVLSGQMVSDIVPYDGLYPIPVHHRENRVQQRRVRTDPWLVEFENIIGVAFHAIPFPVSGALPADVSRDPDDIVVWETPVQQAYFPSQRTTAAGRSPQDPRTQLLFYRPDVVSAESVTSSIRKIFEGGSIPAPGTFFILTAQDYVHFQKCVRFRLSRKRMERMRLQKWNMVAFRNDTGEFGASIFAECSL